MKTPRRHIAIMTSSLAGGGAERKAILIASGLHRRGHRVDLLVERLVCDYAADFPPGLPLLYGRRVSNQEATLARLPTVPQRLIPVPVPWRARFPRSVLATRLPLRQLPLLASRRAPRWAVGVAEYLDCARPDVLLAMQVGGTVAATMATHLAHHPVRIVATAENSFHRKRMVRRGRRTYPFAAASVGASRGVTRSLSELIGVPNERIHTIYNPVVTDDLLRRAEESPLHPWLDSADAPTVLAIGRLNRIKDFPTLLRAFALLATKRPLRLIVLGKGKLLSKLQDLVGELGVAEWVHFAGFVENPYAFLSRASLFVLSSQREGLSNVLIEAMACGCPVVSTDCPHGPAEILEGGRHGHLVPVGDHVALSEAMARTLDAPPSRDALRERAAFFNIENAVDRYESLLLDEA